MSDIRALRLLSVAVLACGLGAPALAADDSEDSGDPFEPFNRLMTGLNTVLRDVVLDPLTDGYQAITPDFVQEGVSNVVSNLTEPLTFGASLLQGDLDNAGTSAGRFAVNSTIGVGGLGDPASDMGLMQRSEDLGQTFGTWGIDSGPHLVLPLLGPTNLRDAFGTAATAVVNPLPIAGTVSGGFVTYSDNQDAIQALDDMAVDPYIAEREAYEQHRQFEIDNAGETDFATGEDPFAILLQDEGTDEIGDAR